MTSADRRALRTAAAVVAVVAEAGGWSVPADVDPGVGDLSARCLTSARHHWSELAGRGMAAGPAALGSLYESLLAPEARDTGAHYTPVDVAERLVAQTAADLPGPSVGRTVRVWDPTCGGGAFLLAAADVLVAAGGRPDIVLGGLWGTDLDPGAVAVTRAALAWWAEMAGVVDAHGLRLDRFVVADPLLDGAPSGVTFDLVVGNPPFQGQLSGRSVRTPEQTAVLRARWGEVVGPYTDTSALFLVAGVRALAPGGRLVMVQPTSVLSARDAGECRAAVLREAELTGLWVAVDPVFDAEVQVCAPVLRRRSADRAGSAVVRRWRGRAVEPVGDSAEPVADGSGSWAALALAAMSVPEVDYRSSGVLGEVAKFSAGFRDEYYGLVGHVVEAPDDVDPDDDEWPSHLAPLITSGLVETGWTAWGRKVTTFGRQRFTRPVVDRRSLAVDSSRAHRWATATHVPKVVIATQTRVGEAAVDQTGRWVASTPTIVATARAADLWLVAAVVCSPVGTLAALSATAGSARSPLAIKHSVSSAARLPLPTDRIAWATGADALRHGDQARFADAMADAYEVVDRRQMNEWWSARAPWRPD